MKMIAGLSVVIAATSLLAETNKTVENYSNVFNGNSYVSADEKIHGNLDLYKTFVHDSADTAQTFIGLNNANIFLARKLGTHAKVQFNTNYGPINVVDNEPTSDNTFKVAEAFVTYAIHNAQIKVGKFFTAFGSYNPYNADKTLIEARNSNLNNNAAELAYAIQPNAYFKVWAVKPALDTVKEYYGAKLGYSFDAKSAKVAADVSLLNDAREMFEAPQNITLKKGNALQGQVSVNYGPIVVAGKVLRASKLVNNTSPIIKGMSIAYDTVFSGHSAQLVAQYERANNVQDLEIASKRVGLFINTPVDKNINLVAGVSERTIAARKLRTTSIGLKATI